MSLRRSPASSSAKRDSRHSGGSAGSCGRAGFGRPASEMCGTPTNGRYPFVNGHSLAGMAKDRKTDLPFRRKQARKLATRLMRRRLCKDRAMRAATIRDGRISVEEHPDPRPEAGELLVRVRAAGLNGADMQQLAGRYPAPPGAPADIPGLELAGEVVEVGRAVSRFEPGDRVMAIVAGGGQAELAIVHESNAMPVPEDLDWTAAGAVPEVFTTAHDALFTQAGLTTGERLLVHGAAGGVGMAAVQLGTMAGARVTATVRDDHAREQIAALGVMAVPHEDFAQHGPFDVILELVGAPNLPEDLDALAMCGRLCVIGVGAGA